MMLIWWGAYQSKTAEVPFMRFRKMFKPEPEQRFTLILIAVLFKCSNTNPMGGGGGGAEIAGQCMNAHAGKYSKRYDRAVTPINHSIAVPGLTLLLIRLGSLVLTPVSPLFSNCTCVMISDRLWIESSSSSRRWWRWCCRSSSSSSVNPSVSGW